MASTDDGPDLMLGWAGSRTSGSGIWVLRRPTQAQLHIFTDAGFPYQERAFFADPTLMERAGAHFYPRITECPPAQAFVNSTLTSEIPPLMFGFDKDNSPGGYILRSPSEDQIRVFRDAGYDFRSKALCADAVLMREAGAEQCRDMNDVPEFVAIILRGSVGSNPSANVLPNLVHFGNRSFHINYGVPEDVTNELISLREQSGNEAAQDDIHIPEHLMRYRAD